MHEVVPMSWWKNLREKLFGAPAPKPKKKALEPAVWLAADDKGNPFGFPILDLMKNLQLTSTAEDAALAERSVSWRPGQQDRLQWSIEGETFPCDLTYRAASSLPDGMLFVPKKMEDKWVVALKGGLIAVARGWTGDTEAIAHVSHDGDVLRVTSLTMTPQCLLRSFGDPGLTFDWLMKTHPLNERIPLPVDEEGGKLLQAVPYASFKPFGHRAFCAAKGYVPRASERDLRSDGALVAAIQKKDIPLVRRLVAEGADVHAPCTLAGYASLHLALAVRDEALARALLDLGADVNQPADENRTPLLIAVVAKASRELLDTLIAAGARIDEADHRRFGVLHAASEVGNTDAVEYMFDKGASVHARTDRGLTPLHIACALGHLGTAKALHALGADVHATSDLGTPLDGARAEHKPEVVAWIESL